MSFVFCLCLTHVMINDYQAGWKGETFVLAGRGVQLGGIATAPGIVTAEVCLLTSDAKSNEHVSAIFFASCARCVRF